MQLTCNGGHYRYPEGLQTFLQYTLDKERNNTFIEYMTLLLIKPFVIVLLCVFFYDFIARNVALTLINVFA